MGVAAFLIVLVFTAEGKPISTRLDAGIRMPPQQHYTSARYHPAAPFTASAHQEPLDQSSMGRRYITNSIRTRLQAETETASAATAEAETKTTSAATPKYVNIFEEPLEKCIEDDYCTYRSAQMATHDICSGIRLSEQVKDIGMAFKAGPVNEDCYSILAYGANAREQFEKRRGFVYIPKCSALPAGLLDSKFSVDMMTGVPLRTSKKGVKSTEDGLVEETTSLSSLAVTRATKQFRTAIESICDLCSAEAPNEKAKANLEAACTKLKAVQLVEQPKYDTSVINVFLVGVVSTFLGAGATFAVFRFRRSAWTGAEESLLSA